MSKLMCDIVTPEAKLVSQEAYMVAVPGVQGEMGFLPGHEPLISVLAEGSVRIQAEKDGEIAAYVIQGGYVEVTGTKVIVLADRACPTAGIDAVAVNKQLEDLEQRLASLNDEEVGKTTLETDIAWCKAQIHAREK